MATASAKNKAPATEANKAPATEANKAPATEANKAPATEANKAPATEANKIPQFVAAISATLGGFCLGTVIGWASSATPQIRVELGASENTASWIASIIALGAATAMFPMSMLLDILGRKLIMLLLVIPFVVGWLVIAFANAIWMYLVGRFLTGFAGGAFCVAAPVYIGEIVQPGIRGVCGSCYQLLLVVGILFAFTLGPFSNVMGLSLGCMAGIVIFGIVFLIMPESPYYLCLKDKNEEATKSLQWFRGKDYDVTAEMNEIKGFVAESKSQKLTLKEKFSTKAAKKSFAIGIGFMFVQQLSGINIVMFHANNIFKNAGSTLHADYCQIIIGVVQIFATLAAVASIEKAGRKLLMIISLAVMSLCLIVLGIYYHFLEGENPKVVADIGWLPVTVLCLYIVAFSIGAGPVPWLMLGELFPTEIKGPASSMCSFVNWILAWFVGFIYPSMRSGIGNNFTFGIFGIINILSVFFIVFGCMETKGKTLEEIQGILGS